MPVGEIEINFGTGGSWEAQANVTGQAAIVPSSKVEAWIQAKASADHSADEHRVDTIDAEAGAIVNGVGFTVWAKSTGRRPLFGRWLVQWVWS